MRGGVWCGVVWFVVVCGVSRCGVLWVVGHGVVCVGVVVGGG